MLRELPHLEFLPVEQLLIHEWHDPQRTPPLVRRIRESGIWRNPPVVAPLLDQSQRYMVLDGANRFTALQEMGFRDILVQVIAPDSQGLRLHTWNHVVWQMDLTRFSRNIQNIPNTVLSPTSGETEPDLFGDCGITLIQFPKGKMKTLCTDAEQILDRVEILNKLVNSYKSQGHLDRTNARDINDLHGVYEDLCGLVIFPVFQIDDIMNLAGAGHLLPTGITRFTIAPRALHINYPLEELENKKPLAQKNLELRHWLQERIANKGIRYYAEPTFLFDE